MHIGRGESIVISHCLAMCVVFDLLLYQFSNTRTITQDVILADIVINLFLSIHTPQAINKHLYVHLFNNIYTYNIFITSYKYIFVFQFIVKMEILRNLKLIQALIGKHGFIKLGGGGKFHYFFRRPTVKLQGYQSSLGSLANCLRSGGQERAGGCGNPAQAFTRRF